MQSHSSFYTESSFWATAHALNTAKPAAFANFLVESKELYLSIHPGTAQRGELIINLFVKFHQYFLGSRGVRVIYQDSINHSYGRFSSEFENDLEKLRKGYEAEIRTYCSIKDLKRLLQYYGVKTNPTLEIHKGIAHEIGQIVVLLSHCVSDGEELTSIMSELLPNNAAEFASAVTKSNIEKQRAAPPVQPSAPEYIAPPTVSLMQPGTLFTGSGNGEQTSTMRKELR